MMHKQALTPGDEGDVASQSGFWSRCGVGGLLMGMANLVPGISGGTMLLAAGVYPEFIESMSEVTRFTKRRRPWAVLVVIGVTAVLSVACLAGFAKWAVLEHRTAAYSLFIGLTLGGWPVLERISPKWNKGAAFAALFGLVFTALLSLGQYQKTTVAFFDASVTTFEFVLGGIAGASAMILPGISGGYLLLLLGQYVPILEGIEQFTHGLTTGNIADITAASMEVIFPVGLGVILGLVLISRLLRWALVEHQVVTFGVLKGVLIGSIVGLWPFQRILDEAGSHGSSGVEYFLPNLELVLISVFLVGLGLAFTVSLDRWSRRKSA